MSKVLKSKKEASIDKLRMLSDSMQCPICFEQLTYDKSLSCINKHSFDVSKTGYVNLSNQADDPQYTKELFQHRHQIMGLEEFYQPLIEAINQEVKDSQLILDAGSGEGSLLNQIESKGLKVGIDLSKQGIQSAAKHYRDPLWMVADLAKIPFKDESVDLLLSILSPANYQEFKRVLAPKGKIIKVLPGPEYFKELRHYHQRSVHDNSLVLKRFEEEFKTFNLKEINYTIDLNQSMRKSLLIMSPLAWSMTLDQQNDYLIHGDKHLSIDLILLVA